MGPGTPGASGDLLRFKEKKWYQKRKIKINNSKLEKWSQVINPTLHRSSPAQHPLSAATGLLSSLGFKWILKEAGAARAGGHHSPYYSALPCPETLVPCSNIPQTKRNICQTISAALPTSIREPFWHEHTPGPASVKPFLLKPSGTEQLYFIGFKLYW